MHRRSLVVLAAAALCLAGCGTQPTRDAVARPIKPGHLLPDYSLYAHPVPYGATLIVTRDVARFDYIETAELQVDGRPVAQLRPGERVELHVYSGERILNVYPGPGVFDSAAVSHTFVFRPGRTYELRVGVLGRSLDIALTHTAD